jgi:hypothetical protein
MVKDYIVPPSRPPVDIPCPYCGYEMKPIEDDSGIYFICNACKSQSPKSLNGDPDAARYLAKRRKEE